MNTDILAELRKERYNTWGERQPLIGNISSHQIMSRNDISVTEKSVLFFYDITGCKGLEFVGFSNTKLEHPIGLSSGIVLYPCFLQTTEGCRIDDPIVRASIQMSKKGRYIYDGWLPIRDMVDEEIRKCIRQLREILGSFSLISGSKFDWEPKYQVLRANGKTHYYSEKEIKTIEDFASTVDGLSQSDRQALLRSIGWLAECIKLKNPESKFLFAVLAIESLCSYIEESNSDLAFHSLAQNRKSGEEREAERNLCIQATLNALVEKNPTRAISEAYLNCVVGIKKKLHQHLVNLFSSDDQDVRAFFNKDESGLSLYEIRHTIAHGSHDIISESHRSQIDRNAHKVERFALRYIWKILNKALGFYNGSSSIHASISSDFSNAIISNRSMYKGPVDMGLLYAP